MLCSEKRKELLTFFSLSLSHTLSSLAFTLCVTCLSPCFKLREKAREFFVAFVFVWLRGAERRACAKSVHLTRPVFHMTVLLHCFCLHSLLVLSVVGFVATVEHLLPTP